MRRVRALFAASAALAALGCPTDPGIEPVDGRLEITPTDVDVGAVPLATPIPIRLQAANVGDLAVTLTATVTGVGAEDIQLTQIPRTILPGASTSITLTLVATRTGPVDATLEITTSAGPTSLLYVGLRANRVQTTIRVTPPSVAFGALRVGGSKTADVEVYNPLEQPATVTLALEDTFGAFRINGPTTARIEGGRAVTFAVVFEPRSERDFVGRVRVARSGGGVGETTLHLSGRGTSSSLVCDTDRVDFADVPPNRCAHTTVRCENVGDGAIEIDSTELAPTDAPFAVEAPLDRPIESRTRVDLDLEFCPTDLSSAQATLDLLVVEADRRNRRTKLTLLGRGGGPAIALPRDALSFGGALPGGETRRRLALDNVGHAPLEIAQLVVTPPDAPFAVVEATAPIAPGGRGYVMLAFRPTVVGASSGTLAIQSNDTSQPVALVALSGVAVAARPCEVSVEPSAIDFGVVQAGAPVTREVTVTASGPEDCAYFDARLEDGARFTLSGPATSGLLRAGQVATFAITYANTSASGPSGDLDAFVVDVPNASPSERLVPLRGTSTSQSLVVAPASLDYGVVAASDTRDKSVAVFNFGVDPHRIEALTIDDSAAYTIASVTPGPLPVVLDPGRSLVVEVRYAPSSAPIDRGALRIASDRLQRPLTVPLTGQRHTAACGRIAGAICAPSGGVPSVGARVSVEGTSLETTTDPDGRFYLSCVPSGTHTLVASRGHFSRRIGVSVTDGQTTTLPANTCLDPTSAQIAVVHGQWDLAEAILTDLGLEFDVYEGIGAPAAILSDSALLASYDIVVLNCGMHDATVRGASVAANLRAFVEGGGSLYASDKAYDAIEGAFPFAIDFDGDDTVLDAAEVGTTSPVLGNVIDTRMLRQLPQQTSLTLTYSPDYALISGTAPWTSVHVVGQTTAGSAPLRPLLVSFEPPAGGRVVFTTFHNTDAIDDPDVTTVLETVLSDL